MQGLVCRQNLGVKPWLRASDAKVWAEIDEQRGLDFRCKHAYPGSRNPDTPKSDFLVDAEKEGFRTYRSVTLITTRLPVEMHYSRG